VIAEYSPGPKPATPQLGTSYTPDGRRTLQFEEDGPIAIKVSNDDGAERVLGYRIPGDGDAYPKDIVTTFPWCVRAKMFPVTLLDLLSDEPKPLSEDSVKFMNGITSMLNQKNEQTAEAYTFSVTSSTGSE
jgi:hypothetical protein